MYRCLSFMSSEVFRHIKLIKCVYVVVVSSDMLYILYMS